MDRARRFARGTSIQETLMLPNGEGTFLIAAVAGKRQLYDRVILTVKDKTGFAEVVVKNESSFFTTANHTAAGSRVSVSGKVQISHDGKVYLAVERLNILQNAETATAPMRKVRQW